MLSDELMNIITIPDSAPVILAHADLSSWYILSNAKIAARRKSEKLESKD